MFDKNIDVGETSAKFLSNPEISPKMCAMLRKVPENWKHLHSPLSKWVNLVDLEKKAKCVFPRVPLFLFIFLWKLAFRYV